MTRLNDHLRRHEWRCACGCINADDDPRCWSCPADTDGDVPPRLRAKRCIECGTNFADPPSRLCPGCEAYWEHQR
jgi:hypothetical protein